MAIRVNGRLIQEEVGKLIQATLAHKKRKPGLAVIYAGAHPAIVKYVERKKLFGETTGIHVEVFTFPEDSSYDTLAAAVRRCGEGNEFSSMIVQLPLPREVVAQGILNLIPPEKDADLLSEKAYEHFVKGESPILPPIVGAVKEILDREHISLGGKRIVVMGQGRLVGMPITSWLRREGFEPEIITSSTENPSKLTSQADILITGLGDPHVVTPDMIKNGAVLIDAGTSEAGGKIAGDIDPSCEEKASVFTPVPGGVGPITVAMLFKNVVELSP